MNCEETRDLLPLYAGGEVEANERLAVEAHLPLCSECSRELDQYRDARGRLGELREVPMAPGVEAEIWRNVRDELFPRRRRVRQLDWAVRYAAVLVIGLAAGYATVSWVGGKRSAPATARTPVPSPVGSIGGNDRIPGDAGLIGSGRERTWSFSGEPGHRSVLPRATLPDGTHYLPRAEALLTSTEREF